jgi:hypothetical protein
LEIEDWRLKKDKLNAFWQRSASHAFFHHINALFGYVPLITQPRQIQGLFASF